MSYLTKQEGLSAMLARFFELRVGARFEFRGHRYEKVALSMAVDENRMGNLFHDSTEVVCEPDALPAGPHDPNREVDFDAWTRPLRPAPPPKNN